MCWEAYWLLSIESSTFHVSVSDVIVILDFRKENCIIYVVRFIQIISWYFDFISALNIWEYNSIKAFLSFLKRILLEYCLLASSTLRFWDLQTTGWVKKTDTLLFKLAAKVSGFFYSPLQGVPKKSDTIEIISLFLSRS
jgi:hypothetical protein